MIRFSYRLSPEWAKQSTDIDLRSVSTEALHYDLFLGDVYFKTPGADFSAPWDWVPVLDFAMSLLEILKELPSSTVQEFEFTESDAALEFKMDGAQVRISSNYSSDEDVVSYEELLNEARRFAQNVVRELGDKHSDLHQAEAFKACYRRAFQIKVVPGTC